LEVC